MPPFSQRSTSLIVDLIRTPESKGALSRHTQGLCLYCHNMQRFAALDTKFLLALAGGEPDAESTIDYLHKNGFFPLITECVYEQLGELAQQANNPAAPHAQHASRWLSTWGILDVSNRYTENGTSQVHAEAILEQGLIPGGTILEAETLVEASCHECELLVTFSDALLNAQSAAINLALIEKGMSKVTVIIASPKQIAERLAQMQSP